jgi:hypothetical protein
MMLTLTVDPAVRGALERLSSLVLLNQSFHRHYYSNHLKKPASGMDVGVGFVSIEVSFCDTDSDARKHESPRLNLLLIATKSQPKPNYKLSIVAFRAYGPLVMVFASSLRELL